MASGAGHDGGHERRDIRARPILLGGAVIVGLLVASFVIVERVFTADTKDEVEHSAAANPLAASYGRNAPPEPHLQNKPLDDLAKLHESEDMLLNHYAWIDKPAGIVRLPIDRAIALTAERGLPARRAGEAP